MVQASQDSEAHELLKREIISLGGDLDDFELLKKVEDGEEEEWRPKKEKDGKDTFDDSEFKKFFAKLDFATAKKSQVANNDVEEEIKDDPVEEEVEVQEPISYMEVPEKLISSVSKAKVIPKKFSVIRFEEEQTWYEARDDFIKEQRIAEGSEEKSLDKNGKFIRVLRERAEKLIKIESEVGVAKERKFFQMAAESGTQKDKVAAMVLKVQNAPISNHAVLDQLVKIVRKRVRREFVLASSHVKDLFLSSILPCTRPLREFHENTELLLFAAENVDTQDGTRALLFAIYEDYAKKQFGFFLDGLDEVLSDPIEEMKIVSLQIIKTLLEEQPEAEGRLLSCIVNKIGDPKKKVVDRASKFITDLLFKHPNMQEVVGYEIENFLWRSNQSETSVLAGINLLNQFVFSSDRHEVPTRLIRVYFQFFQSEIAKNQKRDKKKTELSQKILFSLLTGVNRAFPYVTSSDDADLDTHINNTFSLVHQGTFTVALQALSFLFQAFNSREELGDRFYNSLYRLLLRPELGTEQKRHTVLLNLLYRTLSEDKNITRGKSFIKRVLSICHSSKTPFQAGSLVFVGHLLNEKPVWRSLACAKDGPQTAIGGLDQLKDSKFEDDSDEEENFVDADKLESEKTENKTASDKNKSKGWHHREKVTRSNFDPWARNPSYTNVDGEKAWELVSIANHFHPSVSMFAKNVIAGNDEKYPGDPLNDFTVMRFLDRFVYKNPKAERKAPRSVNQRRVNKYLDTHQLPVTSLEFLKAKEHELGPHDRFMQKFFQMRASGDSSKKKEDQDIDDVDDDEFDRILDGDLKGWENRVGKIDSTLATPKQRKAMKKRGQLEELEDLDEDDMDFGDLYSDEEEEEEISPELVDDFDGILSDESESESPTKRVKLAKLEEDAEQVGEMLDDAGAVSQQEKWELGRSKSRKANVKGKSPRKKAGRPKSSKKR